MEYKVLSEEDKSITAGRINLKDYKNTQSYECSCSACNCACFCSCFGKSSGKDLSFLEGELEKNLKL